MPVEEFPGRRGAPDLDHVREQNARVEASGPVRILANARGVYLGAVSGTGAGGRITLEDVRRHAALSRPAAAVSVPSGRFPDPTPADVDPMGGTASVLATARRMSPEPTLFATGSLPPFTASGLDVAELSRVPWQARPALAAAPTLAEAYRIVEAVLEDDDPAAYAASVYAYEDGVMEYRAKVQQWISAALHEQMLSSMSYPPKRELGQPVPPKSEW